jgi:hypothetical protein
MTVKAPTPSTHRQRRQRRESGGYQVRVAPIAMDIDFGDRELRPACGVPFNFFLEFSSVPTIVCRRTDIEGALDLVLHLSTIEAIAPSAGPRAWARPKFGLVEYNLDLQARPPLMLADDRVDLAVIPMKPVIDEVLAKGWHVKWGPVACTHSTPSADSFEGLLSGRLQLVAVSDVATLSDDQRLPLKLFQPLVERYAADN